MNNTIPLGAHLITPRRGYRHHGIYAGNGRVIHYAGFCDLLCTGPIEEVSLEKFAAGHGYEVMHHPAARYAGETAVARARSRMGEDNYRLLTNNCEHFARWCVDGEARSEQCDTLVALGRAVSRTLRAALRLTPQGGMPTA